MANNGKTPKQESVRQDVQRVERPKADYGENAAETMNMISPEELRKRQDSLMENIGALRFSIARIEYLEGYQQLWRDLVADCRVIVDAHGHKSLVKQIDRMLKDTAPVSAKETAPVKAADPV